MRPTAKNPKTPKDEAVNTKALNTGGIIGEDALKRQEVKRALFGKDVDALCVCILVLLCSST
jgi:hypothetical protein